MANLTKDGFEMKQKFRKEKMRRLKNKAGMLSGGQAKIAAKAEPRDKIDAKDFAVLRAEKAKNRGKGLQDEKMKPGKIMKARMGKMLRPDPTKPISSVPPTVKKTRKKFKSLEEMRKAKGFKPGESVSSFNQRRMVLAGAKEAAKATRLGKIVLPIAAVGVGAVQFLKSKMKKNKEEPKKKMGGGMMMKRPMMARVGVMAGRDTAKKLKEARKKRKADVIKGMGGYMGGGLSEATQKLKAQGKMGGGMMQRPMMAMGGGMMPGYKKGKSVMAKGCKLGRKKPTKMYT